VCFRCNQKGHKSPNCPTKPKGNRKVQLPERVPLALQHEELFGSVGSHDMAITCDTGAQISVVPIECVAPDQLMHGGVINWTPILQIPYQPKDDMMFILDRMDEKFAKQEEDQLYLPPVIVKGKLLNGSMVSGHEAGADHIPGDTVPVVDTNTLVESMEGNDSIEDVMNDLAKIEIEGEGKRSEVINMAEDYGDHGQMAEAEREDEALAKATAEDQSLQLARQLAREERQGYVYSDGVILRNRLDTSGESRQQVCLPKPYREKCMRLAHSKFGHMGRNKMVGAIRPYFHWLAKTVTRLCGIYPRV